MTLAYVSLQKLVDQLLHLTEAAEDAYEAGAAVCLPCGIELSRRAVYEFKQVNILDTLSPTEFLGFPCNIVQGDLTTLSSTIYTMEYPHEKIPSELRARFRSIISVCRRIDNLRAPSSADDA